MEPEPRERAAWIDAEVTALVASLPTLPGPRLATIRAEALALAAELDGRAATVATTLAAVLAEYEAGRAVLEGWGLVATAAHALTRAVAGAIGGLAAVQFELETLLPVQAAAPRPPTTPDVPLAALARRR
ncbi:MAG: hypothetical protein R3B06_21060 [Kofleriaceae bacterium]